MGDPGIPLIRKWENTGQISFENAEATEGREISNGHKLETFWNLLDEELKPKGNKLLSVIELWTRSKQGSKSLNEWLTHVHNLAELCDYPAASKERIIRDVLIINYSNEKAKDKIIRKGHEIKLEEVIGILQTEDSTQRTLQEMNSETKKLHYASYYKKKSGSKGNKKKSFSSPAPKSSGSSSPSSQSTSFGKLCYQCRKPYTKEHEAVFKAKTAKCNGCGEIGHYKNCCKKAANFPKKPQHAKKMHITGIAEQEFYDEEGNRVTVSSQHMLSMKYSKPQQELLIQFGIRKDFHSIDKKVTLKLDTGADVNAFNRTTFQKLFPDVELQPSTIVLENFDKTMVKLMGTFKCFLQWKGKIYRIQAEVMDSEDTPNILSRETTFLMGILKPCFIVKKAPEIPDGTATMNSNSKAEMKNSKKKTTVPPKDVQHIHPDSLKNKPLTQEMIETTYQDVFQGLRKFPGEPYKLRLKENYVPAKHRPQKVPVHLQDAFHEEVQRLIKIDVLELVTEQTEWVNSYVIVEKEVEIDKANAHSPSHTIKKKIRLCLDPKDLNNSLE